jgi:glycosyltransferase involved in cell wall biosynthesis
MKFSFIIPVYKKKPETFRNCLKSLFNMSHKDMEVICVFDGPDPELESVAKEFPVKKSVVIEHGGACKARNEGAKWATGDFLSFWDADCFAEPEMSAMWEMTLKDNLDCDFCYSGYAWADPKMKGYESEPFDPFTLEHYNYIASMFPLARDRFPGWDESLTGMQDWDYWRRVVRAGSKGAFIPGFGFVTEVPDADSISGSKDESEHFEKTKARIEAVRRKLGDPERDVVVHGLLYKRETGFAARILNADFIWNPFWLVKPYKLSLMLGFHPQSLDISRKTLDRTDKDTKRGIYWMGMDAESFYTAPFWQVKTVLKDFEDKVNFHFCNEKRTQDILADMGISAEIVPFPYDAEKEGIAFPEKFKVLVLTDSVYEKAIFGVIKAMPDIEFVRVVPDTYYNMMDFTVSLQYMTSPRLDNNSRNFLIKGRYLISNVDAPHSGYLPIGNDPVKFKNEIINKLRALKAEKKPNMEAREYYMAEASPEKFKERILGIVERKLEVVQ